MPAAGSSKRFFRKRVTIAGAEPKTVAEINAEYDELVDKALGTYTDLIAEAREQYQESVGVWREWRAAELAEVEDEEDDTHQQTTD